MERYLDNIGFFNSKVEFETTFKHKTSVVKFTIHPSIPYKISKIDYTISDTTLKQFFDITLKNSLIKEGDIYNAYAFDDERDRITEDLRNNGYYFFNRNFIQFVVDSNHMDMR